MRASEFARRIRQHSVRLAHQLQAPGIGSALSIADLLAVLYTPEGGWLRLDPARPRDPSRDRFLLSKAHAGLALQAALAERGFFPVQELGRRAQPPGLECPPCGPALALPLAVGKALAAKRSGAYWRTVVLCGDGEWQCGAAWEALLCAAQHSLEGLTILIDANGLQGLGPLDEAVRLDPLDAKLRSFGVAVLEVDGHHPARLRAALDHAHPNQPLVLIARTTKGKGVSFMEDSVSWHHRAPNAEQLAQALAELEGGDA
ncbi:MAG: transketolase [Inhella sp.]